MWSRFEHSHFVPCFVSSYLPRLMASVLGFMIGGLSTIARADEPLAVENLLSAQESWRSEVSLNYINQEGTGVEGADSVSVQTSTGAYVEVPTVIAQEGVNADTLVLTPGLKYGVSRDTEIFGRLGMLYNSTRIEDEDGEGRAHSSSRINDVVVGVNQRFIQSSPNSGTIGFGELSLAQNVANSGVEFVYGKAVKVGFTSYHSIDPLVMGITTSYRTQFSYDVEGQKTKPGNVLLVAPVINFAANPDVTLSTGFTWTRRESSRVNGRDTGITRTSTDLNFGMGQAWSKSTTVYINVAARVSGASAAAVGVTLVHDFEKNAKPGSSLFPDGATP